MTAWVVDYANSHPDLDALAAQGCVGMARYLGDAGAGQPDDTSKNVTHPEVDYCRTHGWGLALVLENDGGVNGGGPARGFAAGPRDGQVANAQADAIGFPTDRPIYYAVDTDAIDDATVADYFRGVASVGGRPVAGYGKPQLMESLLDQGLICMAWTTEAWSGGYRSDRARLFQHAGHPYTNGGDFDENDVLNPDWGQWNPGGTSPTTGDELIMDAEVRGRLDALDKAIANVQDQQQRFIVAVVPLLAKDEKEARDTLTTVLAIKHDADVRAAGAKP